MSRQGFTLIELIVVLGVVSTLLAFATINVLRLQRHTHIQSVLSLLTADMYEQRQRAMNGDTQGRSTIDSYGIYFQPDRYILFHGTVYNASDSANVAIPVTSPVTISSTTFPNSTLVFTKGNGELASYSSTTNSVTISNSTNGENYTITLNQYGTITSELP